MFSPPEVDRAIDWNMNALAVLDDATRAPGLDAELRAQLRLACGHVRVANTLLTRILDGCPFCGHEGFTDHCDNCGAQRRKAS